MRPETWKSSPMTVASPVPQLAAQLAAAARRGLEQLSALRRQWERDESLHGRLEEHCRELAESCLNGAASVDPGIDECGTGEREWELEQELASAREELATLREELDRQRGGDADDELHPSDMFLANGSQSWEDLKRQMLAQSERETPSDKARIDKAIARTDQLLAAKQAELEQLRAQVSAAPVVAAVVDPDDRLAAERDHLKQLQEEWREKMRAAEVEIALERAKLARDRTVMEEQLRRHEDQLRQGGAEPPGKQGASRGRWLARLGLGGE